MSSFNKRITKRKHSKVTIKQHKKSAKASSEDMGEVIPNSKNKLAARYF